MSGRVLPYFRPIYPAIVRQCNLCGVRVGENEYETEIVRGIDARMIGGQYIFCSSCDGHVAEIAQAVAQLEANLDSEYAQVKHQKLKEKTADLLAKIAPKPAREVSGDNTRQDGVSPPLRPSDPEVSRAPTKKARPGVASIPNPKAA